jgi:hypothetical protein
VDFVSILLGHDAVLLGIWFLMFRDNVMVSSAGVEKYKFCLTLWSHLRCLKKSGTKYQLTQPRIPEEQMRHQHRSENRRIVKIRVHGGV